MANVNATLQTVPMGVNQGNIFYVLANVGTALVSTDTLTVTLPTSVSPDSRPFSVLTYGPAAANVVTIDGDLALTSHNVSTGATVLTASGNVALNSKVLIGYIGAGTS